MMPPYSGNSGFMPFIDRLPREWRELVHDFGWGIVKEMRLDGHRDARVLREQLDAWRERRQESLLREIPYRKHA